MDKRLKEAKDLEEQLFGDVRYVKLDHGDKTMLRIVEKCKASAMSDLLLLMHMMIDTRNHVKEAEEMEFLPMKEEYLSVMTKHHRKLNRMLYGNYRKFKELYIVSTEGKVETIELTNDHMARSIRLKKELAELFGIRNDSLSLFL